MVRLDGGSRGKGIEMISYPWLECFLEGDGEGFERIRRGILPSKHLIYNSSKVQILHLE